MSLPQGHLTSLTSTDADGLEPSQDDFIHRSPVSVLMERPPQTVQGMIDSLSFVFYKIVKH